MHTLFIDTTDEILNIGLIGRPTIIKSKYSKNSHSVYTLPLINEILIETKLTLEDIDNIVIINGPGSFTGIRIGLSIAKTISYTLKKDIYSMSKLEALLVSEDTKEPKLAILKDTKGYYICAFDSNNNTLLEEQYITDLEKYQNKYHIVNETYDIKKVVNYALQKEPTSVFQVKANYVKTIEVMNDKK